MVLTLVLIALLMAAPAQADFDPAALMEAVRNNQISEAQEQLTAGGDFSRCYLRNYASIFLPAVAKIGNATILNLFIDFLKVKDTKFQAALDHTLVAVFDNPKFAPLVKLLLDLGADASARALGQTALARAAFAHARRNEITGLDAVKLLLERGAKRNIDVAEDSGMTPLMWACSSDDETLIRLLLVAGADPKVQTPEGRTATMLGGPVCKALLNPKRSTTTSAIDNVTTTTSQDVVLTQALYQAVATGDLAQCNKLLEQGASANVTIGDAGQNLLLQARDADVMRALLHGGADPNWTDAKGWSVLQRLVTRPRTAELVQVLLKSKVFIQRRIENGQDALLLTHLLFVDKLDATSGTTILRLLVQAGADINGSDKDGETLLHLAVYNNAAYLTQIALELGADPQRPNQRGETPLRLATRLKADAVLEVLNQYAVKIKPISTAITCQTIPSTFKEKVP